MPREALPCVRCDRPLTNEFDEMTNQPSGGTAFESEGHYGSTAFDPMDGSFIEVNLCDECLVLLRDKGAVLYNRKRKMVVCEGTIVGWTKAIRPYTPWTGNEPAENEARPGEERLVVDPDDVGNHDLYPEIEWLAAGVMVAKALIDENPGESGDGDDAVQGQG